MLMADTFAIFFSVLGVILGHVALWLLCRGLFPTSSKAAGEVAGRSLLVPLAIGAPITLVALVMVALVSSVLGGVGHALGVAGACAFVFYAQVGLSGAVAMLGARLTNADAAPSPWRDVLRGGTALSFAWVFPFVGWFVLFPLSLVLGAGAATIALFQRLTAIRPARPAEQTMVSSLAPVSSWR